jgi:hypothetical protein
MSSKPKKPKDLVRILFPSLGKSGRTDSRNCENEVTNLPSRLNGVHAPHLKRQKK